MPKETGKIKIVSIIEKNINGTRYHRSKLILDGVNGKKLTINGEECEIVVDFYRVGEEGFDERLKNSDILQISYGFGDEPYKLGVVLDKYNVKFIQDLDDYFPLFPEHVDYGKVNYSKKLVPQIILADAITTTNERLANFIKVYREAEDGYFPISISPNYLPNEGQFEYREKVKGVGKIRVGICGSQSHLPDFKLLKGLIKILGNNKEFSQKCKFVITGYSKNQYWDEIKSFFSGLKAEVEVVNAINPENYMQLYDSIDILLAPLLNNEFNICKSNLKVIEASLRDIPVIASDVYEEKGVAVCSVKQPEDWQKWIKYLIKDDNYLRVGRELGEQNRKVNNWEKRVEDYLSVIGYALTSEYKGLEDVKMFGICYKDEQYTEYTPYMNWRKKVEDDSIFMEYPCIIDIIDNKLEDFNGYVGVVSHKLPIKTGLSKRIVNKLLKEVKYQEYDVINLTPNYTGLKNGYLKFSDEYHPTFMDKFTKLCGLLNLEVKEPKHVVIANQFIAKKEVYKRFLEEVIKPAIHILKTEMKEEGLENAKYTVGLNEEEALKNFGLPYYPMCVFLPERLLSIWCDNNLELKVVRLT